MLLHVWVAPWVQGAIHTCNNANAQGTADRGIDLGQVAVDLRESADVEAEQQALVLGKVPVQRQGELVDLAP